MKIILRSIGCSACLSAVLAITGCQGIESGSKANVTGYALQGNVHGGQQPVSGAIITLYAASTSGYAGANTNILTSTVLTDANGGFSITSKYTCTAGQQMYIVARGGNTGAGANNPQSSFLAALGDCTNQGPGHFIFMNEVTTVASVVALAPFMTSYQNIGSSANNSGGLARAFNSANKLANMSTGAPGGPALPAGAVAPLAEINTMADILAACVNSKGGVAGDSSICGQLFSYATPAGGTAPTEAIGLALAMAKNPTLNVVQLYNYVTAVSPFSPRLAMAPTDWTVAIVYKSGFSSPRSTTLDGSGNVWVANSGTNSVYVLNQSGTVLRSLSGNGLNAPEAVAISSAGDAFIANKGGSTVSAFSNTGSVLSGSPYTVGTAPNALAFDASGDLWVANSGSNSVSELSASGMLLQTFSSGIAAPNAIAIDPK